MFGGVYGGRTAVIAYEPDEWVLHLVHNNYLKYSRSASLLLLLQYSPV